MNNTIRLDSDRTLTQGERPLVMGVINCTPDSFYPESRQAHYSAAVEAAREMIRAGADILDIGGESSRPGSDPVAAPEELERVVPVIARIRSESNIPLSVDTRKAAVAEAAIEAGANMVNDISGFRDDPALARVVADRGVAVVLMHMQGTPKTMQRNPHYTDTVADILDVLRERIAAARDAGIMPEQIIADPGIGFGKTVADNLRILKHLRRFRDELGVPILIGLSRKSFIGKVLGAEEKPLPVDERLVGTLACHAWAMREGAAVLRVHDVAETVQLVSMLAAIATVE
ncbi:MAG: dihydropteroate synthase [Spirochaetaceae bacterium]